MLDFAIFAVTFVVILVGAVLYLYPSSRRASGVPGLNPTEEKDGNLQDIVNRGSLHEFLVGLHDQFGSVASFWFGRRPVVSLGSVGQLRQHINPNRTTDSFETMLKSLLGYQSGTGVGGTEALMRKKVYEGAINKTLESNFPLLLKVQVDYVFCINANVNCLYYICDDSSRKAHYESALAEMESVLKSVIKEKSGRGSSKSTFMDSLLQANLSERQVMEESMVFTLAGCVITANLCIWAVHFLSISEAVQEKLHQELIDVLGDGPVSLDKIPQLRYCQQVLNETVRTAKLTPIAARLQEVEGKVDQHVIPKETLVIYALGVVLQDADTWTLPYRFDPDRFTDESVMKSFSLLGFSGNQACPELRFAYTVAAVLLSTLVRRLRLHRVEGQVVESKYELVTTPKDDTWITVSKWN
uniref:Cytochrome P450, family 20, subfamily A, polypeptide 1 n=1 Tax=Astyanax mexicanus TaxID=7994 RepID=A0A8B9LTQ8_ASTMX